jgi:hypothetical protein
MLTEWRGEGYIYKSSSVLNTGNALISFNIPSKSWAVMYQLRCLPLQEAKSSTENGINGEEDY